MGDASTSIELPLVMDRYTARRRVYLAACSSYLASFSFGVALSYSSPALPDIRKRIPFSDSDSDWFGSFVSIGATLGGLAGGQLLTFAGRKGAILLSSLGFVMGFLLIEAVPIIPVMFVGRALTGLAMAIAALSAPAFIAEISPPRIRGVLVGLSAVSASLGIMFVYTLGKWLDYQWLAVACMAPIVVMVITMPWAAESPRWLLQAGRAKEAREAFLFYQDPEEAEEFEALSVNVTNVQKASLIDIVQPEVYKPLLYTVICMTLQPFSGIIILLFYAHDIFQTAGSSIGAGDSAIILGLVQIPGVLLSSFLIDRFGRKLILMISMLTVCVSLVVMGAFYNLKDTLGHSFALAYGWLPLTVLCLFMFGYCLGMGPLPWILMGEMLPLRIKGIGTGIATACNFAGGAVVAREYHSMINLLGNDGIYWFYATVMAIGFLFVLLFLPETKGKTLEEIEALFGRQGVVISRNDEGHTVR